VIQINKKRGYQSSCGIIFPKENPRMKNPPFIAGSILISLKKEERMAILPHLI